MDRDQIIKVLSSIDKQEDIVDEILTRYTQDEAGQEQKEKYLKMNYADKIMLLTNTLLDCANWEDFETDLVINFDYNNY